MQELYWIIPLILLVLAIVQFIYWIALSVNMRNRPSRQPIAPIMPTNPQSGGASKPAPANPSSRIVILKGLSSTGEIPLPSSVFIIGRYYQPDAGVMVALDEKSISRRHTQFNGDDNLREYYLTDLNSTYGTAIRLGDRIEPFTPGKRMRVYNGDTVQFGSTVQVRFVLPGDTRAAATQS